MDRNNGKLAILLLNISLMILFTGLTVVYSQEIGEVRLGQAVVFRFYDDGIHNPTVRANEVSRRIDSLLDSSLNSDDVRVEKTDNGYSIFWGSQFITGVDPVQARLNNSTTEALAGVWANNFKKALRENIFYLTPSRLVMTQGESATVRVGGIATGPIIRNSDGGNVHVGINQETEEITITPTGTGNTRVLFSRGSARAELRIQIRQLAGEIPDQISEKVHGNAVSRYVLEYIARNAILSQVKTNPGTRLHISGPVKTADSLRRGMSTTVTVPVHLSGDGYMAVRREIPVKISNTGEGFSEKKLLMVSDRPEAVKEDGILFHDTFNREQPTRLLYYHKNADTIDRHFWVELKNHHREPVELLFSGSMAGPSRWGVTVGHGAAVGLMETYRDGTAYSLTVPPGGTLSLLDLEVPPLMVICGYLHMQITQGRELEVLVKNSAGYKKDREELPVLKQPFDPFRIHPKGTFSPADLRYEVAYTVGQEEEAACVIGRAPWLIDPVTGEPNNGNYGVFYHFDLTLKNPTQEKKRVGFYLIPDGVLARGSFILNGRLMDTEIVRKPARLLFAVQDLLPGEEKVMTLTTTPEGGSYYPVRVVIETVAHQTVPARKMVQEELIDWPEPEDMD